MKIAVLYICTGDYSVFFDDFYKSAEQNLLVNHEKQYFVWSDDIKIVSGLSNVTFIHKKCAGFPLDSLFRFEMFMQVENQLKQYDYIYFFNSNALITRPIGEEILPDETGLVIGVWPYSYSRPSNSFNYERSRRSLAYVAPYKKNYIYYMGGLNGGSSEKYLAMVRTLCQNIRTDYAKGIIAIFHDESHLNAYLRHHSCKRLGREYCLPEEWVKKGDAPKIVFRNKVKLNGCFNKGRKQGFLSRHTKKIKKKWHTLRWYLMV